MIIKLLRGLVILCVFSVQSMYAQGTVSGTITDASDSMTLTGVNVTEKGTSNGAITNFDGSYSITTMSENAILQFSYLGYTTKEIAVNGQSNINTTLEESAESLDEVVITAFGFEKKTKSVGYSITQVKGEELNRVKTASPLQALRGKVLVLTLVIVLLG